MGYRSDFAAESVKGKIGKPQDPCRKRRVVKHELLYFSRRYRVVIKRLMIRLITIGMVGISCLKSI